MAFYRRTGFLPLFSTRIVPHLSFYPGWLKIRASVPAKLSQRLIKLLDIPGVPSSYGQCFVSIPSCGSFAPYVTLTVLICYFNSPNCYFNSPNCYFNSPNCCLYSPVTVTVLIVALTVLTVTSTVLIVTVAVQIVT